MSFGAASRQSLALGPGSHSACAACARESRGGIGANPSTALSRKSVTQRSEVEGYPGPSATLAKRRLLFPFAEVSDRLRIVSQAGGSVRTMSARKRFIHWLSMHKARLTAGLFR